MTKVGLYCLVLYIFLLKNVKRGMNVAIGLKPHVVFPHFRIVTETCARCRVAPSKVNLAPARTSASPMFVVSLDTV